MNQLAPSDFDLFTRTELRRVALNAFLLAAGLVLFGVILGLWLGEVIAA